MSVQSPTDKWRTRFGGTWLYSDHIHVAAKGTRKQDLIATSSGAGLRYMDSDAGERVSLSVHASIITAGDLDGDGKGDFLGLWRDDGVGVKYPFCGSREQISPPVDCIAIARMR